METKIAAIQEKIKTRPSRFYSPELKKEILEICEALHSLGWTRKQIQNALNVGYQSIDAWKKPNVKIRKVQTQPSAMRLISPSGWEVSNISLSDLKVLLS